MPTSVAFSAKLHERWPALVLDASEPRPVDLPPELYLRELGDLDLESAQDICDFVSSYGNLVPLDWASLELDEPAGERTPASARAEMAEGTSWVDLIDIIERARLIRDATRLFAWVASSELSLGADSLPGAVANRWESTVLPPPSSGEDAASALELIVNAGLRSMQPYVRLTTLERPLPNMVRDLYQRTASGLSHYPDLMDLMTLQLANHIIEGADYRQCHNEACRRRFVRQRGGAESGHCHSQGVLYCSPSCARAQAQREYRRRQARKREGP